MEALHDVVKAGKVRYIGASSMARLAVRQGAAGGRAPTAGRRFVSMQPELSLLYREEEREMLPLCLDQGVGVIPWSPLARGRLARPWGEHTPRIATDVFGATLFAHSEANDRTGASPSAGQGGGAARCAACPGGAGLAAGQARGDGADHRRVQAGAPRRRGGGAGPDLSADDIPALEAPYLPHAVVGFEGRSAKARRPCARFGGEPMRRCWP